MFRLTSGMYRSTLRTIPAIRPPSARMFSSQSFENDGDPTPAFIKFLRRPQIQMGLWFAAMMAVAFQVAQFAQEYKYMGQKLTSGSSRTMNVDELEQYQRAFNKQSKAEDTKGKGMDEVMKQLYEEHIADKDLQDWENIRFPRKSEPETIIAHHAFQKAKMLERLPSAATFEAQDYAKIKPEDVVFDFGSSEEKDQGS